MLTTEGVAPRGAVPLEDVGRQGTAVFLLKNLAVQHLRTKNAKSASEITSEAPLFKLLARRER